MNNLKMLALTAIAAATLGTGALAAAPSASAKPDDPCRSWLNTYRNSMALHANRMAQGQWESANAWLRRANSAMRAYSTYC